MDGRRVLTKYRTIVADPPWPGQPSVIGFGGRRVRPTRLPYQLVTLDWIKALPVADLADEQGAHLFVWCTRKVFREGVAAAICRTWGFEPIGEIIWGLRNPGMGTFVGNDHEPIIVARRGDVTFAREGWMGGVHFWRQPYQVGTHHGKAHSHKPEHFLDMVEQVSPGPYVELFARRHRMGWDVWGNESANTAQLEIAT